MRELPLEPSYIDRLKHYFEWIRSRQTDDAAKSDYWKLHSQKAAIEFRPTSVCIGGGSGFYIPPDAPARKWRLIDAVQATYKRAVLSCDRGLRLSAPYAPSSYVTCAMAYDSAFGEKRSLEPGCFESPFHFDVASVQPRFRTAAELRRGWFLRHRFGATAYALLNAFYHDVISHFLDGRRSPCYLEIGAGNGNLASFFHHYDGARVTIVDLPETILYSATYLKSVFPEAAIVLPNEMPPSRSREDLDRFDFAFLLPEQTGVLNDQTFDVMVNLFSMQEMRRKAIEEYFRLVGRVGKQGSIWCNVNRVEKFCTRDEPPSRAYEYPYDRRNQVLVHQIDEFLQRWQSEPHVIHIEQLT